MPSAKATGHEVRLLSRRPRSETSGVEYVVGDIASGAGLEAALDGVDAVIHAASDPSRPEEVDVGGTRRLVDASRAAGVAHFVYVSIVGIDQIPVRYYRMKWEAERILSSSGLPHTILRATQFHTFVAWLISQAARVPLVLPLPSGFKFQTVDEAEVAARLFRCLDEGPRGRVEDFGGPEVLTLDEMAGSWMKARGMSKTLVRLPLPGAAAASLRAGANTAPGGELGSVRWHDWLAHTVGVKPKPIGARLTNNPHNAGEGEGA